jgi:hypothetical protein
VSTTHGSVTVLLNAVTGRYYTLNETAGQIWQWLCDGVAPNAIVARLEQAHGVAVEVAREDLRHLLSECAAASLLDGDCQC